MSLSRFDLTIARRPLDLAIALAFLMSGARAQDPTQLGPSALLLRDAEAQRVTRSPHYFDTVPGPTGGIVVLNCQDAGEGSLRDAMLNSFDREVIDLTQLTCSKITLTSGSLLDPVTTQTLYLKARYANPDGTFAPSLTIDAGGTGRAITHLGGGLLGLGGIVVENGLASFTDPKGGCIFSGGRVFLLASGAENCSVHASGNSTGLGGAIYAPESIEVKLSTISGNSAQSESGYTYGGALFSPGLVSSTYSTIDGNTAGGAGYGGALAGGYFVLNASTVSNNVALYDGAIASFSNVQSTMWSSTVTNNVATGGVGGIEMNGPLVILDSTIASNGSQASHGRAGGVFMDGNSALTAYSTIFAGNIDGTRPADVGGSVGMLGSHDLILAHDIDIPADTIASDPMLADLADNGGHTKTRALLAGSPAIDAGLGDVRIVNDERGSGFPRQIGFAPDIGAFESPTDQTAVKVQKNFAPITIGANGTSVLTITLSNSDATAATLTFDMTDIFPEPLTTAESAQLATTCPDGIVSIRNQGGGVTLARSAQIPASGSCMVTVNVTAAAAGNFTNTIPAGGLATDVGSNLDPASAILTVTATADDPIFADGFDAG